MFFFSPLFYILNSVFALSMSERARQLRMHWDHTQTHINGPTYTNIPIHFSHKCIILKYICSRAATLFQSVTNLRNISGEERGGKQIISMQFLRENCAQTITEIKEGNEKKESIETIYLSIRVKCIKFHAHTVFGINLNLHLKVNHKYIR